MNHDFIKFNIFPFFTSNYLSKHWKSVSHKWFNEFEAMNKPIEHNHSLSYLEITHFRFHCTLNYCIFKHGFFGKLKILVLSELNYQYANQVLDLCCSLESECGIFSLTLKKISGEPYPYERRDLFKPWNSLKHLKLCDISVNLLVLFKDLILKVESLEIENKWLDHVEPDLIIPNVKHLTIFNTNSKRSFMENDDFVLKKSPTVAEWEILKKFPFLETMGNPIRFTYNTKFDQILCLKTLKSLELNIDEGMFFYDKNIVQGLKLFKKIVRVITLSGKHYLCTKQSFDFLEDFSLKELYIDHFEKTSFFFDFTTINVSLRNLQFLSVNINSSESPLSGHDYYTIITPISLLPHLTNFHAYYNGTSQNQDEVGSADVCQNIFNHRRETFIQMHLILCEMILVKKQFKSLKYIRLSMKLCALTQSRYFANENLKSLNEMYLSCIDDTYIWKKMYEKFGLFGLSWNDKEYDDSPETRRLICNHLCEKQNRSIQKLDSTTLKLDKDTWYYPNDEIQKYHFNYVWKLLIEPDFNTFKFPDVYDLMIDDDIDLSSEEVKNNKKWCFFHLVIKTSEYNESVGKSIMTNIVIYNFPWCVPDTISIDFLNICPFIDLFTALCLGIVSMGVAIYLVKITTIERYLPISQRKTMLLVRSSNSPINDTQAMYWSLESKIFFPKYSDASDSKNDTFEDNGEDDTNVPALFTEIPTGVTQTALESFTCEYDYMLPSMILYVQPTNIWFNCTD